MSSTEIAKGFKKLNPGPLDEWYGPYANTATACAAIPNSEIGGINFRMGKVVGINTSDGVIDYSWRKGFADADLSNNFDGVVKNNEVVEFLGNEISSNSQPNRLSILNKDVSNIHNSGGSITLVKNTSPSAQQSMLSFQPTNAGLNQFDLMVSGKIDYTINSVFGFWLDTSEFLDNTTLKMLVYFHDENIVDLGNNQEIVVNKASLLIRGFTFQSGAILEGIIKNVVGTWSFVEYLVKPNSNIGNVSYLKLYFVLTPLVALKNYYFSSFTFLNGQSLLNPYSTYSLAQNDISISNEKIIFFSDSITWADKYQKVIQRDLPIIYKNNAVPGSCITPGPYGAPTAIGRSLVERINEVNAENPSVVVELAATNDFGYEVPLGLITDTGTDTFYGACKAIYAGLLTHNPKLKIIVVTPLFGNNGLGPSQGETNEGVWHKRKKFADAKIEVAGMFGIPVWDAFRLSGIGIYNYPQWLADGIHPNDAGYEKFGKGLTSFLKTIL